MMRRIAVLGMAVVGLLWPALGASAVEIDPGTGRPIHGSGTEVSTAPGYCTAVASSQFFEVIQDIDFGFTATGGSISVSVGILQSDPGSYGAGEFVNAWIDFDGDGEFEPEEQVLDQLRFAAEAGFPGALLYGSVFAFPENRTSAPTFMRVTLSYGVDAGPCGAWTFGSVRDFEVELPQPSDIDRLTAVIFGLDTLSKEIRTSGLPKSIANPIVVALESALRHLRRALDILVQGSTDSRTPTGARNDEILGRYDGATREADSAIRDLERAQDLIVSHREVIDQIAGQGISAIWEVETEDAQGEAGDTTEQSTADFDNTALPEPFPGTLGLQSVQRNDGGDLRITLQAEDAGGERETFDVAPAAGKSPIRVRVPGRGIDVTVHILCTPTAPTDAFGPGLRTGARQGEGATEDALHLHTLVKSITADGCVPPRQTQILLEDRIRVQGSRTFDGHPFDFGYNAGSVTVKANDRFPMLDGRTTEPFSLSLDRDSGVFIDLPGFLNVRAGNRIAVPKPDASARELEAMTLRVGDTIERTLRFRTYVSCGEGGEHTLLLAIEWGFTVSYQVGATQAETRARVQPIEIQVRKDGAATTDPAFPNLTDRDHADVRAAVVNGRIGPSSGLRGDIQFTPADE